jgi:hypothetical protein
MRRYDVGILGYGWAAQAHDLPPLNVATFRERIFWWR